MPFSSPGKAIAIYTPPSRERMQALVERHVHQPPVHKTVKLMGLRGWNNGINNVISAQAMREAGTGLACLDKGMADGGGFRIIRRFVRNTQGVFDDKVLRQHSPLLFDFLKTLMEHFSFENVAMHRMTAQDMHCDPHAKFAPADEMHILLTVNGADHCFALGSSEETGISMIAIAPGAVAVVKTDLLRSSSKKTRSTMLSCCPVLVSVLCRMSNKHSLQVWTATLRPRRTRRV